MDNGETLRYLKSKDNSLNHNNSILSEHVVVNNTLRSYLREKGKRIQEYHGEGNRIYYPHTEIAKRLGMSKALLEKKLDRNKPITRDFVIALSVLYCLSSEEADELLHICDLAGLDSDIVRENDITEYLEVNAIQPNEEIQPCKLYDISDINNFLKNKGHKELDISAKHKVSEKHYSPKKLSYKEIF